MHDAEIKPQHEALVALLKQHLGLRRIDMDAHRLVFTRLEGETEEGGDHGTP